MIKKFFVLLVGLFVLPFILSLPDSPLAAQEKEEDQVDVMDMSLEDLLNVEITTAGKKAEKVSEIPASIVIVTRAEIEKYGYQTVEEVLENITGYYKIDESYWFGTTSFGVRGFFSGQYLDNIVVMVNNVPQNEYAADSFLLNVPVEAIDRLEVVRGPLSVIYGNGAFFGAINIVTNEVPKSGPTNQLSVSTGSMKAKRINLRAAGEAGDFKYVFDANVDDNDGIDVPYADMTSKPFLLPFYGLAEDETTKGRLANNTRYFNIFASYKNFTINVTHTKVRKGRIVLLPAPGEGSYADRITSKIFVGYRKEFSAKFSLEGKFIYFNTKLYDNYALFHPDTYTPNTASSEGYQVEIDAFLKPSDKFKMTLGISTDTCLGIFNFIDAPGLGLTNFTSMLKSGETIDTYAAFTQVDWTVAKILKFTLGARVEKQAPYTFKNVIAGGVTPADPLNLIVREETYNKDDLIFIPRAAAILTFNEKNILKLMYGKAIKRPSPGRNNELFFWSGVPKDQLELLREAEIETFELNYILAPSPKFFASLSIFRNNLDKLFSVSYKTDAAGNVILTPSNMGKMNTTGAALTLKTVPVENLHLEASLMYQKSENKQEEFKGIDLGYSPKVLGYIKGYYDFKGGLSIGFTGRYVDKMLSGWDLKEKKRYGAEIGSYFILGLNLRWDNIWKNGFININVANVLDEEIRYPATSTNYAWADRGFFGQGRTLLVTLGWKF